MVIGKGPNHKRINRKYAFNPLIYGGLLGVSIILDIAWLWVHTGQLWGTEYVDSSSQSGLRKFTIILSYLLLFAEVGVPSLSASGVSWESAAV